MFTWLFVFFVGLCARRAHEHNMKKIFHHARDNTKYDELENTKLSVCRVACLMENSVRNFLFYCALENTRYSVSMDADSVKKFLRNALESSRHHVTLDAHCV